MRNKSITLNIYRNIKIKMEVEALIWAMECMRNLRQFQVTFATDCSQSLKMVLEPEKWPAFESYLEDIKILKESFLNAEIIHVPWTGNLRAESLARSVRKYSSFIVHMDLELPVRFTESVWVCKSRLQNNNNNNNK